MTALRVLAPAAWAGAVAGELVERLRRTPSLRVCLPTGATPVPAYAALAARIERGDASFAEATVIMLDEWVGLPPGDPARCDARIRAQLLDRLPVPPVAVHTIDVDVPDLAAAAARHAAIAGNIDLAVLGLGMDGHVGFNEPGSYPDSQTRVVRLAASRRAAAMARYGVARVPTAGITLGMDQVLAAAEAWLLVTGERKARIVRRALREPEGPDCPASYLQHHPNVLVFVDEAAAALLA